MSRARRDPVDLYIVRHADAEPNSPDGDAGRALTPKGLDQVEILADVVGRLDPHLDAVLSSPLVRARQTAGPLADAAGTGKVWIVDAIASGTAASILSALHDVWNASWEAVAVVGHEPRLGELVSLLIAGRTDAAQVRMRKGTFVHLAGDLRPSGMRLEAHVPLRLVRRWLERTPDPGDA